jgi:hypothetical protein
MPLFDTVSPLQDAAFSFATRGIQNSGATTGFVYVFICPAAFANGATFHIDMAIGTNGNSGSQSVNARIYALNGSGNWDSAAPLSSIASLANSTTNFPVNGVAQMDLTLTSALTKGTRYALRIFANSNFSAVLNFQAVFATNDAYANNADEYHINGVTLTNGTPNLAIGTDTAIIGKRCIRRVPQDTAATSAATSQIGFKFALPSGLNYTLNNIFIRGLTLDTTTPTPTAGTTTPRILDATGTTTIATGTAIDNLNLRQAPNISAAYTFTFPAGVSLVGGTQYTFVVESAKAKILQFVEVEQSFDSIATANGVVTAMEVVQRNGTSGVFSSSTVVLSYTSIPIASIDATVTAGASSGLAANPLAGYVR